MTLTMLYDHVINDHGSCGSTNASLKKKMRKRIGHMGCGLSSLVRVVIPVFDTAVIIVTAASYELQKKVAHKMSDHCDRILP